MSKELPLYGFGSGSGGANLNFKIIGGTTQPSNPTENTIWVNTSIPINGYAFSSTEPDAPSAGMVWVKTGAVSPAAFSLTQKNPIMIYPMAAMQYIGGAWTAVGARSYIGGRWTEWTTYLYDNGAQFEAVTGGWAKAEGSGTATIDTSYMSMVTTSDAAQRIHVATNSAVSLSNYKTLYATVEVVSVNKGGQTQPKLRLGYADDRNANLANVNTKTEVTVNEAGELTVSMDISTVTGAKYIIVGIGYYRLTVRVTRVWLE